MTSPRSTLLAVTCAAIAAGCGRLEFDPRGDGEPSADVGPACSVDADVDASSADDADAASGVSTWVWPVCGDDGGDFVSSIALGADGAVYAVGNYGGTVTFAEGIVASSVASSDAFVARFPDAPVPTWVETFGADVAGDLRAAATSPAGFAMVGVWQGGATRAPFAELARTDPQSALALELDAEGAVVSSESWASSGGSPQVQGRAIAVSPSGVYQAVGGLFRGSITTTSNTVGATGTDGFVTVRARRTDPTSVGVAFDATGDVYVNAVAVADDGSSCVGGRFEGDAQIGGASVTTSGRDGFVARIDANGAVTWAVYVTGSGHADVEALVMTSTGCAGAMLTTAGSFTFGDESGDAATSTSGFFRIDDPSDVALTRTAGVARSIAADEDGSYWMMGDTDFSAGSPRLTLWHLDAAGTVLAMRVLDSDAPVYSAVGAGIALLPDGLAITGRYAQATTLLGTELPFGSATSECGVIARIPRF